MILKVTRDTVIVQVTGRDLVMVQNITDYSHKCRQDHYHYFMTQPDISSVSGCCVTLSVYTSHVIVNTG